MLWEEVEMSEVPISHTVSKDMKSVKRRIRIFTDWEKSHKEFHLSVTGKKPNVPTHMDRIDISYNEIYLLQVYTSLACKVKKNKNAKSTTELKWKFYIIILQETPRKWWHVLNMSHPEWPHRISDFNLKPLLLP